MNHVLLNKHHPLDTECNLKYTRSISVNVYDMENTMQKLYVAAAAAIAISVLTGCSQNAPAPTPPPAAAAAPTPAQVQAIQNDPRISPQMKAAMASGKPASN